MSSAGTWTGACSALKEVPQDVNDKSPIIDGGKKVGKRSENSAICTKSDVVCQMVGSVPADRRRLVSEIIPDTTQNPLDHHGIGAVMLLKR